MGRLVLKLQRRVRAEKLSGQVLKVRTGNLRRSIDTAMVESSNGVVGVVSTNTKYGRIHEYGFKGTMSVKAHMRTNKKSGKSFKVRSFPRSVNLPERSFLRSALGDMTDEIKMEILAACNNAIKSKGTA